MTHIIPGVLLNKSLKNVLEPAIGLKPARLLEYRKRTAESLDGEEVKV